MSWGGYYPSYVSVAQRRANAAREVQKLVRKGMQLSPVAVFGRAIASTFWGKAWCNNLESYSDFDNRLPRGRTYVRNGSVVDLQIESGEIISIVSGSHLYRIAIRIQPLDPSHWKKLRAQCGTQIGSLVELLQGKLSTNVMEIVTHHDTGLFPVPAEIEMSCSCPDWADMCKHVAATLYGVGNRLDSDPQLLFKLRQVNHLDLITGAGQPAATPKNAGRRRIAKSRLADVFGIELESDFDSITRSPLSRPGREKSIPMQEKKANRIVVKKRAITASSRSANAKAKAARVKDQAVIVPAQQKRKRSLLLAKPAEENASPSSQSRTTGQAAKTKAKSAVNKATRRTRSTTS